MKKFFTLLLVNVFFLTAGFAQLCMPNPDFMDADAGVYPPPYDEVVTPDGGITESACINQPYEFVFTVVVSETITIGGASLPLDSIVLISVDGLPEGMTWDSNPEDGTYPAGSQGCARISGTASSSNALGDYSLLITVDAYIFGVPNQLTFPNDLIAPGEYTLTLLEENSADCLVGTENVLQQNVAVNASPNPTSGFTSININSLINTDLELTITDMTGRVVRSEAITANAGQQSIDIDVNAFATGMYLYSLSNEMGVITKKLIVE